jgi:hypothetical protein
MAGILFLLHNICNFTALLGLMYLIGMLRMDDNVPGSLSKATIIILGLVMADCYRSTV